jgi:aminoglycoside 2'-N-acetyltransferase I
MESDGDSIRVLTSEDLTAAGLRQAVVDVCVAAHELDEFRLLFEYLPPDARHVLAFDRGTLVSHAVVTTRGVQPHGLPVLRTAFVDAVSTLPSHQNRGYASATMRRLADVIGDYEIGCLQTDRESFYEHLGWEPWRGPLGGRSGDGVVPTPDQRGVMVLRLPSTPPIDLDSMLTIECQPGRIWE